MAVIFQSSLDDQNWTTLGNATYGAMTYAQAVAQTSLSGGGNEVWSYTIPTESPLPGGSEFFIRALAVVPTSENGSIGLIPIAQALYRVPTPDFNSSTTINAVSGSLFYYQIAGAYNVNVATNYTATGLPPGLSLNATTGVISGTPTAAGTYSPVLTMTNASGSTTIPNAYVPNFTIVISGSAPTVATGPVSRLINLSDLAVVAPGSPLTAGLSLVSMYPGLNITGPTPKAVLLRAVGPGLTSLGVTGVLDKPLLQIFDKNERVIASNEGWNASATLIQIFNRLGAFPLTQGSADCVILTTLDPGSYTVKATSGDGTSGSVLVEAYDADLAPLDVPQRFFNLSGNGPVSPGYPLTAGFVVQGTTPKTLLIRGIGPALINFGIPANVPDPVLTLFNKAGKIIAQNQGWTNAASVNQYPVTPALTISAADSSSYAFALTTANPDSVLLVTLPPGLYTTQVTSASATAGTAMVEIYEVPGQTGD